MSKSFEDAVAAGEELAGSPRLYEIVSAFLSYSFDPIGWDWSQLTTEEKKLCSFEEFKTLKALFKRE